MSNTVITTATTALARVGGFMPLANKSGKITAVAEKRAHILNRVDQKGLQALARDGRGAIGKQALDRVLSQAEGLPQYRLLPSLDGSQWGNLLSLLVAEYGETPFNRATMRGKAGAALYIAAAVRHCDLAVTAAQLAFDAAETIKGQASAEKRITAARATAEACRADAALVAQWVEAAEAERAAAMLAAEAEQAALAA